MLEWHFWDWIAYGCLGISAFGIALSEIWRRNSNIFAKWPQWSKSPKWSFVPAIMITVATIILVVKIILPSQPRATQVQENWYPLENVQLTPVQFGKFWNQEVEVDGKSFQNCTFEGVTFVFKGQQPFIISHSKVSGPMRLKTSKGPALIAASCVLGMLDEFASQKPGVRLTEILSVEPLEK
jgi:hypothetical protein